MNEIPYIQNRVADRQDPKVAMVLTGAAYNSAERAHVASIEADIEAMTFIASHVGSIAANVSGHLPPQLIVVRDASNARSLIGTWDTRAPSDAGSPLSERYFWASDLRDDRPRTSERTRLIEMAHTLGAPALTEISVASWDDEASLARAYATGLLLAQKPVHVTGPKPSLLGRIGREFSNTLSGRSGKALRLIAEIDEMARGNTPINPPFVIRRDVKDQLR